MGVAEVGVGKSESGCPEVGNVLHDGCVGSPVVWVRDVCYVPHIGRTLGSFHHRVVFRLTGRTPRRGLYGMWVYPTLAETMAETELQEEETCIFRRKNTAAHYISIRPIVDLCLEE